MLSQVISDVRHLVQRLREHEEKADTLISSAQQVSLQSSVSREYQSAVEGWNAVSRHQPRAALVHNIQQETRLIRQLEEENRELRAVLEEHRAAVELIMFKYREHTRKLAVMNRLEASTQRYIGGGEGGGERHLASLRGKVGEMADVMCEAARADVEGEGRVRDAITRLTDQNRELRHQLRLIASAAPDPEQTPHKETQTD